MKLLLTGNDTASSDKFQFTPQSITAIGSIVLVEGCDQERSISWVHAWTLTDGVITQVVELKVGLHCDECIKKILKAVKKIEDIETYDVDTQLNKITVSGRVTTEEVMKALQKIGKQSTIWEGASSAQLV
uniref:HMA domain-containing protein n=1 Tax=Daucus carota subsp. sativus TaxID=79200 RepID=A0A164TLS1_DAUCS